MVQRSRLLGHHRAYVRIGVTDAGYRDLESGEVHCADEAHRAAVTWATAGMVAVRPDPEPPTVTALPVPEPLAAAHLSAGPHITPATTFAAAALRPLRTATPQCERWAS